jgi:hypothetical protein
MLTRQTPPFSGEPKATVTYLVYCGSLIQNLKNLTVTPGYGDHSIPRELLPATSCLTLH